jgi:hypothetical protein
MGENADQSQMGSKRKTWFVKSRARYLVDAWLILMGFALAFGMGLWMISILPETLDPEWQPAWGAPGIPGARPSTMHLIGWINFGIALVSGVLFSWWRVIRGFGIGLFAGWMIWALFGWIYK